jgi:hypothetical protein
LNSELKKQHCDIVQLQETVPFVDAGPPERDREREAQQELGQRWLRNGPDNGIRSFKEPAKFPPFAVAADLPFDSHPHAAGQQRAVLEGLVAAADVGRVRELDVLTRQQQLHRPGLKPDQRGAILILLGAVLTHDIVGPWPGDEAREYRRNLLPVELGVVVLVEQPQPDHGRRDPRHAPDLPFGDRVEHVADLFRRHTNQLARTALAAIAGVGAMEVVGDPPPDPIVLDAEDDLVAVVIHSYSDFISEPGKMWDRIRAVAGAKELRIKAPKP